MSQTRIEWADTVWNPVTGCTPVSEGCHNCYARRMAYRLRGRFGYPEDDPFRVTLHSEKLDEPFRWRKPRKVFVGSMGDLFHEDVPDEFIRKVFGYMHHFKQHTFMVLTKRPERMATFIRWYSDWVGFNAWPSEYGHVWLGTTAENQDAADERIPILLQIPAAVRFVSVEPMLGPVDLTRYLRTRKDYTSGGCYFIECSLCGERFNAGKGPTNSTGMRWREGFKAEWWAKHTGIPQDRYAIKLHVSEIPELCKSPSLSWIICGGETGTGARPCHPDWVRSLRDQAKAAGVPFFFKSWGQWVPTYTTGPEFELRRLADDEVVMSGHGHGVVMKKVGKKEAGRLLDGREWNEVPEGVIPCPKATAGAITGK